MFCKWNGMSGGPENHISAHSSHYSPPVQLSSNFDVRNLHANSSVFLDMCLLSGGRHPQASERSHGRVAGDIPLSALNSLYRYGLRCQTTL